MNLTFSQVLNIRGGQWHTTFKQKVLNCFEPLYLDAKGNLRRPKKHTIRVDLPDRWEKGKLIHFQYGPRYGKKDTWLIYPCKGTEYISIVHPPCCGMEVYVHDQPKPIDSDEITKLNREEIEELALNDGFDSVEDFQEYFKEDFHGKLIHWTDLRYGKKG